MNELATKVLAAGLANVTTANELVTALDATVTVTPANTHWSYKGLAQLFGSSAVGQIDETLKAVPGLDWVRLSLATSDGLDFADAETQAGLAALRDAGKLTPEAAANLMSLGVREVKRWSVLGLPSLPTVEAAQAALDEIAAQAAADAATVAKSQLRAWLRQRCDEIDLQIIADQIMTQEAVVAAWGE